MGPLCRAPGPRCSLSLCQSIIKVMSRGMLVGFLCRCPVSCIPPRILALSANTPNITKPHTSLRLQRNNLCWWPAADAEGRPSTSPPCQHRGMAVAIP